MTRTPGRGREALKSHGSGRIRSCQEVLKLASAGFYRVGSGQVMSESVHTRAGRVGIGSGRVASPFYPKPDST